MNEHACNAALQRQAAHVVSCSFTSSTSSPTSSCRLPSLQRTKRALLSRTVLPASSAAQRHLQAVQQGWGAQQAVSSQGGLAERPALPSRMAAALNTPLLMPSTALQLLPAMSYCFSAHTGPSAGPHRTQFMSLRRTRLKPRASISICRTNDSAGKRGRLGWRARMWQQCNKSA